MKIPNKILTLLVFLPALSLFNGCGGGNSEPKSGGAPGSASSASSSPVRFGDVVLRSEENAEFCPRTFEDGSPCVMDHDEAVRYCEYQNTRLPTAREFAQFTAINGAVGIRESAFGTASRFNRELREETRRFRDEDYFPIYQRLDDSQFGIDFYYNPTGYRETEDEAPSYSFWTSSQRQPQSFYLFDDADNADANLVADDFTQGHEVRCVIP